MKKRFKNERFNKIYNIWINATKEQVEKAINKPGSNYDGAFKIGYLHPECKKYKRSWILYPIYVAGKEYKKINKI